MAEWCCRVCAGVPHSPAANKCAGAALCLPHRRVEGDGREGGYRRVPERQRQERIVSGGDQRQHPRAAPGPPAPLPAAQPGLRDWRSQAGDPQSPASAARGGGAPWLTAPWPSCPAAWLLYPLGARAAGRNEQRPRAPGLHSWLLAFQVDPLARPSSARWTVVGWRRVACTVDCTPLRPLPCRRHAVTAQRQASGRHPAGTL